MSVFDGKTLDEFREEQRKAYIERFETRKRIEAAQRERINQEIEAAKLPRHEEMKNTAARLQERLSAFHPGDPRAVSEMRSYLLDITGIVAYILDITASDGGQSEND